MFLEGPFTLVIFAAIFAAILAAIFAVISACKLAKLPVA